MARKQVSKKNQNGIIKKLKKQVRTLEKKHAKSANLFRSVMKKMRKLGTKHKKKLAAKMRGMKNKIASVQASTYAKVAADIERKMLKSVESKAKSLRTAISKFEKSQIAKLTKSITKKGKKVGKVKRRAKSALPAASAKQKSSARKGKKH